MIELVCRQFTKRLLGFSNLTYTEVSNRVDPQSMMWWSLVWSTQVDIESDQFIQCSTISQTRGHQYKLCKNNIRARATFLCERTDVSLWNNLARDTVDFTFSRPPAPDWNCQWGPSGARIAYTRAMSEHRCFPKKRLSTHTMHFKWHHTNLSKMTMNHWKRNESWISC